MRITPILGLLLICSTTVYPQSDEDLLGHWEQTKIRIAAIAATDGNPFMRSVRLFHPEMERFRNGQGRVTISGDADTEIRDARQIHILGDLNSDIHLDAQSEVVIAGSVSESATIYVNNISSVYVGGSFDGALVSTHWAGIYIDGNFNGSVVTSHSIRQFYVGGDFEGEVDVLEGANPISANLMVDGFIDEATLKTLYAKPFNFLKGTFQYSNSRPGIYYPGRTPETFYVIEKETQ